MNWYNENDPKTAAWLKELVREELLPAGVVDERSIHDLEPNDPGANAHFFAGIGGWPYALRLAGWPTDWDVWTGSCPCQPFSVAGQQRGAADQRHLWPIWYELIRERRPPVIFGEQVASNLGREWVSGVRADLEALGYAVGIADLCAAGVGAPHIRQRLFWVADSGPERRRGGSVGHSLGEGTRCKAHVKAQGSSGPGGLGNTAEPGLEGRGFRGPVGNADSRVGGLADDTGQGWDAERQPSQTVSGPSAEQRLAGCRDALWSRYDLIPCGDGKARRVESGTFPLAHGVPARVGRLRGYGNAIVPQAAATFIRAFIEYRLDRQ